MPAPEGARSGVRALVVDVDGVVRRWDDAVWSDADRAHGLPPGSLKRQIFSAPDMERAVTGAATDEQWRAGIADRLAAATGAAPAAARGAVAQWSRSIGVLDRDVLELLREQRALRRVVLLSNATDRLDADLAELGVTREVDAVYATWRLGVSKPSPEVYRLVAADLGLDPQQCAFVDDSARHVRGARAAGMRAHLFTGAVGMREFLARL